MKQGTTGWVGTRLREVREARGLSGLALAEILGVSRQAVSQYESGQQSPRPEISEIIADKLRMPLGYFLLPARPDLSKQFFYRSLSNATKAARSRVERRYDWLTDIVSYLQEWIELPEINFPDFDIPTDPAKLSFAQIEILATETRRFWKLGDGPISNVLWLLENNGVIVTTGELGADTLDAFSEWTENESPYVFLGTDKASAARSRFDAAHELAHLILHRRLDPMVLTRPGIHELIEDQAHRFAGSFLLPAPTFANDFYVPTLNSFQLLKPKWGVSIGLIIKRSEHLDLISEQQARFLWMNYARRGWKKGEPFDDRQAREKPRVLAQAIETIISEGVQSKAEILNSLQLRARDIEELTCLPTGFLNADEPTLRLYAMPERQVDPALAGLRQGGGALISFSDRKSKIGA